MLRRLVPLLAIPLLIAPASAFAAKRHPAQGVIHARPAVHYYRAKPAHPTLTQAPRHGREAQT